jgi:sugar lactone lactonase YvrE
MVDTSLTPDYLYRGFLQIPVGVVWGPDEHLYLADWTGRHVVRIAGDFSMDDLPFWQTVPGLQQDGPRDVDFDSQGNLYVNNHSSIFRIAPDGTVTELPGIKGGPVGSLLIGPGDELYYTDRNEQGALRQWQTAGGSRTIVEVPLAENMAFGLDGSLYLTQMGQPDVLKVDLNTQTYTTFAVDTCGFDP